jgi:hypothetical protein
MRIAIPLVLALLSFGLVHEAGAPPGPPIVLRPDPDSGGTLVWTIGEDEVGSDEDDCICASVTNTTEETVEYLIAAYVDDIQIGIQPIKLVSGETGDLVFSSPVPITPESVCEVVIFEEL